MSLMAELGEGPPPPKTQTHPTPAVQTYRPSFSQPPPNPMVSSFTEQYMFQFRQCIYYVQS